MENDWVWSSGMRLSALTLARAAGNGTATLQFPAPPLAGDTGEELGLRTPLFESHVLCPVLLRHSGTRTIVLVPAILLEEALGLSEAADIRTALLPVCAVLIGDGSFGLSDVEVAASAGGKALLYRLLLEGEGREVS